MKRHRSTEHSLHSFSSPIQSVYRFSSPTTVRTSGRMCAGGCGVRRCRGGRGRRSDRSASPTHSTPWTPTRRGWTTPHSHLLAPLAVLGWRACFDAWTLWTSTLTTAKCYSLLMLSFFLSLSFSLLKHRYRGDYISLFNCYVESVVRVYEETGKDKTQNKETQEEKKVWYAPRSLIFFLIRKQHRVWFFLMKFAFFCQ